MSGMASATGTTTSVLNTRSGPIRAGARLRLDWLAVNALAPVDPLARVLRGTRMPPSLVLDHCVIAVSDWQRSNAFYRDVPEAEIDQRDAWFGHYRFGDWQLNVHGPGFEGLNSAKPVEPGNSDLCLVWAGPIDDASRASPALRRGDRGRPDRQRLGGPRAGRHVYFRDPDGSLLEFVSYA